MPRFLIHVHTAWCGEEKTYAAIATDSNEKDLLYRLDDLAYDNFIAGGGVEGIYMEEFPDIDLDDLTEEEKGSVDESDYYGGYIEKWDESRPEEEWSWYELVYNSIDAKV